MLYKFCRNYHVYLYFIFDFVIIFIALNVRVLISFFFFIHLIVFRNVKSPNMSEVVTYYNDEYSPIEDAFLAAQARDNIRTVQGPKKQLEEDTQKRRRSRYDKEVYSLPSLDDDDPPVVLPPIPVPTPHTKGMNWKAIAIIIILIGILVVVSVVRYK